MPPVLRGARAERDEVLAVVVVVHAVLEAVLAIACCALDARCECWADFGFAGGLGACAFVGDWGGLAGGGGGGGGFWAGVGG